MKLSATSIIATFATLSGVLAQTPDMPPTNLRNMEEQPEFMLLNAKEGYHVRCDYDAENQNISEDEAKASGAKWKVLMTML
ncbi:hypothetical protein ARSEF4850_009681 [Beauveria asiatica]